MILYIAATIPFSVQRRDLDGVGERCGDVCLHLPRGCLLLRRQRECTPQGAVKDIAKHKMSERFSLTLEKAADTSEIEE